MGIFVGMLRLACVGAQKMNGKPCRMDCGAMLCHPLRIDLSMLSLQMGCQGQSQLLFKKVWRWCIKALLYPIFTLHPYMSAGYSLSSEKATWFVLLYTSYDQSLSMTCLTLAFTAGSHHWRLLCLGLGFILLLLAPFVSQWVPFYYSSSMALGVLLVVLILLFQVTVNSNVHFLTANTTELGRKLTCIVFLIKKLLSVCNSWRIQN